MSHNQKLILNPKNLPKLITIGCVIIVKKNKMNNMKTTLCSITPESTKKLNKNNNQDLKKNIVRVSELGTGKEK